MATPKPLVQGVYIPNSATTMFTATRPTIITGASVTNQTGAAVTVTISIVPSGGTPGNEHRVEVTYPIPTNGRSVPFPSLRKNLNPGDVIRAVASSSNVASMFVDGLVL